MGGRWTDNCCPPPRGHAAIARTSCTDPAARTRPQARRGCSDPEPAAGRDLRGPGVGRGPGVRQAGPSRALPRGVGSHSHPWAASPGPVPARPQQLSAPTRAASPGPGAERPRRQHQLPSAGRRPSLSALREAVGRGRRCPLRLLFLSPSSSPHHSHFGQPGSPSSQASSPPSPGPHRLLSASGDTGADALLASESASTQAASSLPTEADPGRGGGGGGTRPRAPGLRVRACAEPPHRPSPGARARRSWSRLAETGHARPKLLRKSSGARGDSRGVPRE